MVRVPRTKAEKTRLGVNKLLDANAVTKITTTNVVGEIFGTEFVSGKLKIDD
jgi:hypothetical protein